MLNVCVPFWTPNSQSYSFSRCYNETWVEKLYRGFARNLSRPFKFICFTERRRTFSEPIEQERFESPRPIGYGACIEPYKLNKPMILVGLDTVITGNIDHLADYCLNETKLAVPRDPYHPTKVCNGVALVPAGHRDVYDTWRGENDMQWLRIREGLAILDDLFPGDVVSFKAHVMKHGIGDARIVYLHGNPKMHELNDSRLLAHWT